MKLHYPTKKTRLATSRRFSRARGALSLPLSAARSRALELAELEQRIVLSASPMMLAPEILDASSGAALTAESASLETGVEAATPLTQTKSQDVDELSGSNISTDPTQTTTRELVFLDTSIADYQTLLDDLWANDDPSREIEVVLLSGSMDGVNQISTALAERKDIDAVHIISHGSDRSVKLGSVWLSYENLSGYVGEMSRWGSSLCSDAGLLFYGCDLAASEDGQMLIEIISTLTGADVAASDDPFQAIL